MSYNWSTATRYTVLVSILVLLALFLYVIRPLISPLIIAALLAYMLYPLVKRVEVRTRRSYPIAVGLIYFPFLLVLIATPGILIPLLIRQVQTLSGELSEVIAQLELLLSNSVTILGLTFSPEQLAAFLNLTSESFTPAAEATVQVLEATSTSLLWFLVILVTLYYLLLDWQGLRDWFVRIAPDGEQAGIHRLLQEINQVWRAYLRGTLARL